MKTRLKLKLTSSITRSDLRFILSNENETLMLLIKFYDWPLELYLFRRILKPLHCIHFWQILQLLYSKRSWLFLKNCDKWLAHSLVNICEGSSSASWLVTDGLICSYTFKTNNTFNKGLWFWQEENSKVH